MKYTVIVILSFIMLVGCKVERSDVANVETHIASIKKLPQIDDVTTIHIFVALCDNVHQGIVPVPSALGNGQDLRSNLYWGAAYGLKTYFKRSEEWTLINSIKQSGQILERAIFQHKNKNVYLVADAYDGKYIKHATKDFLQACAGNNKETINIQEKAIGIGGDANLIAYIGHDGLMDFQLDELFENQGGIQKDAIVLACYSKRYFEPHFRNAKVNPLVWTTGLMAPEAYTIHDAITGYILNETNEQVRIRAAKAYSKYQKCSLSAAKRLLITK